MGRRFKVPCGILSMCFLLTLVFVVLNPYYSRDDSTTTAAPRAQVVGRLASTTNVETMGSRVTWSDETVYKHRESDARCGWALLSQFEMEFDVSRTNEHAFRVTVTSPNTTDVWITGRLTGNALVGARVSRRAPVGNSREFLVSFNLGVPGVYEADIVVTWVADRYLGQHWSLPDRNDNPSFDEKKRKCLALKLSGAGCDRFGVLLYTGSVSLTTGSSLVSTTPCDYAAAGSWLPVNNASALLNDPVGLNLWRDQVWSWEIPGCPSVERSAASWLQILKQRNVTKIAIIGDSMMVELFNALRFAIAPQAPVVQGRFKRLRSMELSVEGVTIKFFRSYTTSGGHSVIADARTILDQLGTLRPHLVLGNLAVLHWQQNMRSVADWRQNLRFFRNGFAKRFPDLVADRNAFYVGPTLIQMGRTQGLQPQRTAAFARSAREELAGALDFVDIYNISVARRESSFDGQHWACYHTFGGVNHLIGQLVLQQALRVVY